MAKNSKLDRVLTDRLRVAHEKLERMRRERDGLLIEVEKLRDQLRMFDRGATS